MYQHDWELLDRQLSHPQPTPRGRDALAFVGLFLAGMTAGAFLFAGAQPVQTASEHGKTALSFFYGGSGNPTR
jgi:hypothetical protein